MRGFTRIGALMAGAIATFGMIGVAETPVAMPPTPRGRRRKISLPAYGGGRSNTTSHNQHGKLERRMRQIAVGSLRHENGLDPSVPAFGLTIRQHRQHGEQARVAAFEAWQGDEKARGNA